MAKPPSRAVSGPPAGWQRRALALLLAWSLWPAPCLAADAARAEVRQLTLAGKLARAADGYEDLLLADPENLDLIEEAARVLAWAGRLALARQLYDSLLALAPARAPEWRLALARLLAWRGRLAEARADLEAQLRELPQDPEARLLLAQVLRWQGQRQDALVAARQVAREHPDRADAALLLLELQGGEPARWEELRERFPADAAVGFALARRYLQANRLREAEPALVRARFLARGDAEGRLLLSRLRELQGEIEAAVTVALALAEDQPGSAAARDRERELRLRYAPGLQLGAGTYSSPDQTYDRAVEAEAVVVPGGWRLVAGYAYRWHERPGFVPVPSQRLHLGAARRLGEVALDLEGNATRFTGAWIPGVRGRLAWLPLPAGELAVAYRFAQVETAAGVDLHEAELEGRWPLWPGAAGTHRAAAGFYADANRHYRWGLGLEQDIAGPWGARLAWQGQRFDAARTAYETVDFDLAELGGYWRAGPWSLSVATGTYRQRPLDWSFLLRLGGRGQVWLGDRVAMNLAAGYSRYARLTSIEGGLSLSYLWW